MGQLILIRMSKITPYSLLRILLSILLVVALLPFPSVESAPAIFDITRVVTCDTSTLINFNTSVPTHAYIEYGLTASYGSSTVDDPARYFKEQAIPITGLTANTTYHYRIIVKDATFTTATGDFTFTTAADNSDCPNQPTLVDTRMPDMTGATEATVTSSAQFASAISAACAASGKRLITVTAGTILTGPFTLCNKVDSNWIVVRTSAYANLEEGRRVSPSDTASMFTITTTSVDAPIVSASGAHHWRFIGAEITINASAIADAPAGPDQNGLVRWGTLAETSESQWTNNMVLDRCYVHGVARKNTVRGVTNVGTDNAIIDSYFSEFHSTNKDSQAIFHAFGRRLKMLNNYLEAGGEPFISGGVDTHPTIPVTTPSDFEFSRNSIAWNQCWKTNGPCWDGINWVTKNHWETKSGIRFLVFANIFDKWWSSEQTGGSIAIKSSDNDKDPSVVSRDITWFRNKHTNLGSGLVINGSSWADEESLDWTRNVWFIQNLFEINGDVWDDENTGNSSPAAVAFIFESIVAPTFRKQYPDSFRLIHNTFTNAIASQSNRQIHGFSELPTAEGKGENFVVQDNIFGYGAFGIKISGTAEGLPSLNAATNSATRTWSTNLIAGSATDYPLGNTYIANFNAVQFINFLNGLGGNYRLAAGSPGKNAASDGTDIGVNVDALDRAVQYAATGNWSRAPGTVIIRGKVTISGKIQ